MWWRFSWWILGLCSLWYVKTAVAQQLPTVEFDALRDLYTATNGANWLWRPTSPTVGIPWNFSTNPCSTSKPWQGIECSSNCVVSPCVVTSIVLNSYGLVGSLPASLSNLALLQELRLTFNSITGTIPSTLSSLSSLTIFDLSTNMLHGTLPVWLSSWHQLSQFSVAANKFTGPIPSTLWNLTKLIYLELEFNQLSGTISDSIGQLSQLQLLLLNNNQFNGTLPTTFGQLTQVAFVYLNSNQFQGSIPSEIGNLSSVIYLYLFDNYFTGSIPATLSQLSSMFLLDLQTNMLEGSIPSALGNLTNLKGISVGINQITGSIPNSFQNIINLEVFDVGVNLMTGPVPDYFKQWTLLEILTLFENFLTGTIPDYFDAFPLMQYLSIRNNFFHGQVPVSMEAMHSCVLFRLSTNALTGSLSNTLFSMENLTSVWMNNNWFTGSIPSSLEMAKDLNQFFFNSNFFTGSIEAILSPMTSMQLASFDSNFLTGNLPSSLCAMPELVQWIGSNNFLTGTFPSGCSPSSFRDLVNLEMTANELNGPLPNLLITNSLRVLYFDQNQFSGTIPQDWFAQGSNLSIIVLSINCLSGTIPESLCTSPYLIQVSLDGLHSAASCERRIFSYIPRSGMHVPSYVSGTVPSCLASKPLLSFVSLSGNSLQGTIPHFSSASLGLMVMSNNVFTGPFPDNLWLSDVSVDVSFNRIRDTIPSNAFSASTQNTTLQLNVNRLSGVVNSHLVSHTMVNVLEGNMFSCNAERTNIPKHDPFYTSYNCGSDATNNALIAFGSFIGIVFIVWLLWHVLMSSSQVSFLKSFRLWAEQYFTLLHQLPEHQTAVRMEVIFGWILSVSLLMVFFGALVLIPTYSVLGWYSGTIMKTYVWSIAATYIHGMAQASTLLCIFVVILGVVWYSLPAQDRLIHHQTFSIDIQNTNDVISLATLESLSKTSSIDVNDLSNVQDKNESRRPTNLLLRNHPNIGRKLRWVAVVIINTLLMLTINICFVSANIKNEYSPAMMSGIAILLSLFKIVWTRLFIELATKQDEWLPAGWQFEASTLSLLLLSFSNNIIMPFCAELVAAPDCFLYAVTEPPAVFLSQPQVTCATLTTCKPSVISLFTCSTTTDCSLQDLQSQIETQSSWTSFSYIAPFHYSYQCASTLVTTFAPVFIYRSLFVLAFNTVFPLALLSVYRSSSSESMKRMIVRLLPMNWKPNLYDKKKFARIANHLTISNLMTSFATLFTFGVLFPPLILLCVFSVAADVWSYRLLIGRVLSTIDSVEERIQVALSLMIFGFAHEDCRAIIVHFARYLISFAAVLWAWLLFDTLGDVVGAKKAIWIALVMGLTPWIMWMSRISWKEYIRYQPNKYIDKEVGLVAFHGDISDTEPTTDNTITNPLAFGRQEQQKQQEEELPQSELGNSSDMPASEVVPTTCI